jgi:hypothetical protein
MPATLAKECWSGYGLCAVTSATRAVPPSLLMNASEGTNPGLLEPGQKLGYAACALSREADQQMRDGVGDRARIADRHGQFSQTLLSPRTA